MRRCRVYDNKGATADQFTIITILKPFYCIFSSSNPNHPQGVWSAEETPRGPVDEDEPERFGERISFNSLPERVQQTVKEYLA